MDFIIVTFLQPCHDKTVRLLSSYCTTNKVEIVDYEMVNEPPKTLSPPAQPVTTLEAKGHEDVHITISDLTEDRCISEDVSLSREQ